MKSGVGKKRGDCPASVQRQASWYSQKPCRPASGFWAFCIGLGGPAPSPLARLYPLLLRDLPLEVRKRPWERHRTSLVPVQVAQPFHPAGIRLRRRNLRPLIGLLIAGDSFVSRAPPNLDDDTWPSLAQRGDVLASLECVLLARAGLLRGHPSDCGLSLRKDCDPLRCSLSDGRVRRGGGVLWLPCLHVATYSALHAMPVRDINWGVLGSFCGRIGRGIAPTVAVFYRSRVVPKAVDWAADHSLEARLPGVWRVLKGRVGFEDYSDRAEARTIPLPCCYCLVAPLRPPTHLRREISEKKWAEACQWAGGRPSGKKYKMPSRQKPDGTVAGSSKRLASRFRQLKTRHSLTEQYLYWTESRHTAQCWWCRYRTQTGDHLYKVYSEWKAQQKIL